MGHFTLYFYFILKNWGFRMMWMKLYLKWIKIFKIRNKLLTIHYFWKYRNVGLFSFSNSSIGKLTNNIQMAIFLWTGKHETQTSDKSSYMRKLEKMKHYFSTLIQLVKKNDLMCVSHLILAYLTFIIFSWLHLKVHFAVNPKILSCIQIRGIYT